MRVVLLLQRWIDILAAMLLGLRETWRSRRSFVVARDTAGYIVRRGGGSDAIVARIPAGAPAPAELVRDARRHLVTFELRAEEIAVQQINVPASAREFLAGIVGNQIERLSPWPGDQVAYGITTEAGRKDANVLDVRVLMVARSLVKAVCDDLAAAGSLHRVVACAAGPEAGEPAAIWSRLDGDTEPGRRSARRQIGAAMAAVLALSAGLATWAQLSAASIRAASDDLTIRSAALQRQLQSGRSTVSDTTRDPAERAWALKKTAPSSVVMLEALSRAIPDDSYATEISLQGTTMHIVGMTSDAPSLIAPLERSGQFADVHFFAPTTRAPDRASFVFHIEGRVTPHLDPTER